MIKFRDLKKEDYEPIMDSFDNSMVHNWFKDWIRDGVEKHPNRDVSQSSFQKYLNTREYVPEDCTAYNILKKFKKEKSYELLKSIRIQAPKKVVKVEEKVEEPEVDLSKVKTEEPPKIITENRPQHIVYNVDTKAEEENRKPITLSDVLFFSALVFSVVMFGLLTF